VAVFNQRTVACIVDMMRMLGAATAAALATVSVLVSEGLSSTAFAVFHTGVGCRSRTELIIKGFLL
jgi:hypothetical protein